MKKIISIGIIFSILLCFAVPVSASNSVLADESFSSYSGGNAIAGWSVAAKASNLTVYNGPSGKAVRFATAETGEIMTKGFAEQASGQILVTADICASTQSNTALYLANASGAQRVASSIKNPNKQGEWTKLNMLLDLQAKTLQSWFDDDYENVSLSNAEMTSCSKLYFANWGTADANGYAIFDNVKVVKIPETFSAYTSGIHSSFYDVFPLSEQKSLNFSYQNNDTETKTITVECVAKDEGGNILAENTFTQSVFSGRSYSDSFVFELNERSEGTVSVALSDTTSSMVNYREIKFICMNTTANQGELSGNSGINAHMGHGRSASSIVPLIKSMGVSVIRDGGSWSNMERQKGVYDFSGFTDQMFNETYNDGTKLLYILAYGNTLYSANEKDIPTTKEYMNAWLKYVEAIVTRYKDKVDYWQVWNEPNIELFNPSHATAAQYTELLKQTYLKIKAIDPTSKVVGGGLAGAGNSDTRPYLRQMLEAGAGDYMDILDVHPYRQATNPEGYMAERLPNIQADLDSYYYGNIEIWVGELGWYTGSASTAVSEEKQAAYSIRSRVLYDDFNRKYNKNGKFCWYDFQNDGTDEYLSEHNYGMTESVFKPKPAFYAYSAFNYLVGNKKLNDVLKTSNAYIASYGNDTYVAWRESGSGNVSIPLSAGAVTVYNMYGDVVDIAYVQEDELSYTAFISEEPIFIVKTKPKLHINDISVDGSMIKISGSASPGSVVSVVLFTENATISGLTNSNALDYINALTDVKTNANGSFECSVKIEEKEKRNYKLRLTPQGLEPYETILAVGEESVAMLRVLKNNVEIKSLKDVKEGDVLKIQGYYYGNEPAMLLGIMTYDDFGNFDIMHSNLIKKDKSIEFEYTVGKELKSIDIYLWDGFDTIKPLYPQKNIK